LRQYDRLGLVSPGRATGRGRRYSEADVVRLREIARLSQEEGINLAGVKRILELSDEVAALKAQVAALTEELARTRLAAQRHEAELHASYRRDLVPRPTQAIVVWHPTRARRTTAARDEGTTSWTLLP
jgi:MerR family transcriptional regulator/heat shock protein HspR